MPQTFRNLVPDSALVEETIQVLRAKGGRAHSTEVAEAVLELPGLDPTLATALVGDLVAEDWRVGVSEDSHVVEMLCEDDECRPLSETDFVVFDIETTGPKMPLSRIMEIGATRVSAGRIVAEFQTLVNPRTPIPPFIAGLTGIRDEMVAGAPTFEEVAADWLRFAGTAVLVAHNAVFDVRFINHEIASVFPGRHMMNSHICTVSLARRLLPELKSFRLVALAEHFSVPHRKRHRAGDDARATARVFLRLLEQLHENGVRDLDGARRFKAERSEVGDQRPVESSAST
ncbi:MAG TPA: exonuclease domain-containing protein [Pyrinomonadaceae bacterium]|jgi:DNA polymerase-3 subunit epsilon|nr:exonuclease domain-containing protein [Pyrinomonadaceae bacterium]